MKKNEKKAFFKRGSAELLSFVIILPIVTLVISFMLFCITVSNEKQRLEYITYSVARCASITDTYSEAMKNCQSILNCSFDDDTSFSVEMKRVDEYGRYHKITNETQWEKGEFIAVTVTVQNDKIQALSNDSISSTIVVMLEG